MLRGHSFGHFNRMHVLLELLPDRVEIGRVWLILHGQQILLVLEGLT